MCNFTKSNMTQNKQLSIFNWTVTTKVLMIMIKMKTLRYYIVDQHSQCVATPESLSNMKTSQWHFRSSTYDNTENWTQESNNKFKYLDKHFCKTTEEILYNKNYQYLQGYTAKIELLKYCLIKIHSAFLYI